jgi:hypothetical protein
MAEDTARTRLNSDFVAAVVRAIPSPPPDDAPPAAWHVGLEAPRWSATPWPVQIRAQEIRRTLAGTLLAGGLVLGAFVSVVLAFGSPDHAIAFAIGGWATAGGTLILGALSGLSARGHFRFTGGLTPTVSESTAARGAGPTDPAAPAVPTAPTGTTTPGAPLAVGAPAGSSGGSGSPSGPSAAGGVVNREPVLLSGLGVSAITLAAAFGFHLTDTQLATVVAVVSPLLAHLARHQVTPVIAPRSHDGTPLVKQ